MKYINEHKIVTGDAYEFELESDQLSKEGFLSIGQFAAVNTHDGIIYSQLMTKSIEVRDETIETES